MSRPLRLEVAGGVYHVTSRGNERRPIYQGKRDHERFLELVGEMNERYGVEILAYVMLGNHYHLVVRTVEANLGRAIQWLNVSYSVWYNRKHHRSGHLFQGRYWAQLIELERILSVVDYVHLNPARIALFGLDKKGRHAVEAGRIDGVRLEGGLRTLREYRWSSFGAYSGIAKKPDWLDMSAVRQRMGGGLGEPYRQHVEKRVKLGMEENPWEELKAGLILGSREFISKMQRMLVCDKREQFKSQSLSVRVEWGEIVKALEDEKGERWEKFVDRHGDTGRDIAFWIARRRGGYRLREIGELAGGLSYQNIHKAVLGLDRKMHQDRKLAVVVREVMKRLNLQM